MKEENNIKNIYLNLIKNNVDKNIAKSFIKNNIQDINNNDFDINRLFYIFNNNYIYAIVYAINDDYKWSILLKNEFKPFISINEIENNAKYANYIIEMIINFANSKKIKEFIPNIENMTIENKLNVLKKMRLNSNGYHIK